MAAQRAGQAGHVPVHSGGASQVAQVVYCQAPQPRLMKCFSCLLGAPLFLLCR